MARNLATSLATVKDLNIYKLDSIGKFRIEPKTSKECCKIALLGIVYGILSLQLKVHGYRDADYLGTSLSGKTTLCTHWQELYGQGSRDHEHIQVCKTILQDLLVAFHIAWKRVNAETGLPDRYRLVSNLFNLLSRFSRSVSECCARSMRSCNQSTTNGNCVANAKVIHPLRTSVYR